MRRNRGVAGPRSPFSKSPKSRVSGTELNVSSFTMSNMRDSTMQSFIDAFKEEGIDLILTLPEGPTDPLVHKLSADPYFTVVTVAAEGHGLAMCAGASFGGRKCVFITGIAGLLVGAWALAQVGPLLYSMPMLILASYRGDIGDRSGIPGQTSFMFTQVTEPLLDALHIPYRILSEQRLVKRTVSDAFFSARGYSTPIVLLLTGEVLW